MSLMKSLIIMVVMAIAIFTIVSVTSNHTNNTYKTACAPNSVETQKLSADTIDSMPNDAVSIVKVDSMAAISEETDADIKPTIEAVDRLSDDYQQCLNKGRNMLGCTREYNAQIVYLSDKQYDSLLTHLNADEQNKLKDNQTRWLKDKDKEFRRIEKGLKKDLNELGDGEDYKMILLDRRTAVLKKRLIWLINYKK